MSQTSKYLTLQPGDQVMVINAAYFEEWNGVIATIRSPYSLRRGVMDLHTMRYIEFWGYRVELPDGRFVSVAPHQVVPISDPEDAEDKRRARLVDHRKETV